MRHMSSSDYSEFIDHLAELHPELVREDPLEIASDIIATLYYGMGSDDEIVYSTATTYADETLCPVSVIVASEQSYEQIEYRAGDFHTISLDSVESVAAITIILDLEEALEKVDSRA